MPILLFIFFLLMVIYSILVEYYNKAWNQIPVFSGGQNDPSTFLSIVIAVRNESKNISALINSLKQQNYQKELYEVIIVDDDSTDNTWQLLNQSSDENFPLVCLKAESFPGTGTTSHKKRAIQKGVDAAKGNLIVTTDADCIFQQKWLLTIAKFYEETNGKFIAAPVKIEGGKSLLTIFQKLDFLMLQGITGASVHKRFHSMCNGANLAYEKNAFFEVNGFEGIDNIPSGDDMLLMHKIYTKYPDKVFYLKSKEAIVTTKAEETWQNFFHQRIRWASKADTYQDKRIFWVLVLVFSVNAFFLVLTIAAIWNINLLFFLLLLLIGKIIVEFPFVQSVSVFFGQRQLLKYFPLLQPLHIIYTVIAGLLGKFGTYEWKGRRISKQPVKL